MYGLPDSAVYGTYKRIRHTVKRTRRSTAPDDSWAWLAGWALLGLAYGIGRLVVALIG